MYIYSICVHEHVSFVLVVYFSYKLSMFLQKKKVYTKVYQLVSTWVPTTSLLWE